MRAAKLFSATIAFEWPAACKYWQYDKVRAFMKAMQYRFITLNGCMFGLQSMAPKTRGLSIKKPWTIATDCHTLTKHLNRQCTSYHHFDREKGRFIPHAPCAGVDTKQTEGYTDEFAVAVHRGHRDHLYGGDCRDWPPCHNNLDGAACQCL